MTLLKQYSNGTWDKIETEREDFYIEQILKREPWLAPRLKREPMTTKEQVLDYLKTGKKLSWDDDMVDVTSTACAVVINQPFISQVYETSFVGASSSGGMRI